jgi:ABC-type glycerol-3-phosphate transport system substrate-binding protein
MTDPKVTSGPLSTTRRELMRLAAGAAAVGMAAPWALRSARAESMDLAPYESAKIDWKQVSGEAIQVAGISFAGTDRLLARLPEFKALTGIDIAFQKIPPLDLRQKAVLDLSAKTGNLATSYTDPMYYPLYVSNNWIEPLDQYLNDKSLTDPEWFDVDDIIPGWRASTSMNGKLYGLPFDGEATIQFCRKDLYAAKGIQPAETFDQYVSNAAAIHDPANHIWGAALRGFAGPGQNMYIYPSIFLGFGGKWFTPSGKLDWNTPEALAALEWYIDLEKRFAPPGVENWNWPELGDAFGQGRLGSYIDGFTQAYLFSDPTRSRIAGDVSCARWPKGPSGRRVTSIWNWSFQLNAALSDRAKKATWLFIQWATSKETQIRTSYAGTGSLRFGVNRTSIWQTPAFRKVLESGGENFIQAATESMAKDTDADWRPRVPQWPAVGTEMATAVQAALVGQMTPKQALETSQAKIDRIMRQ